MEVVVYPAKVLRKIARRIAPLDGMDLQRLYTTMVETMDEYDGVGLAAPQIGESVRFIVAHNIETKETKAFVNPQILEASPEKEVGLEGCLSLPGLVGDIERHLSVRLRWHDFEFKTHEATFRGHFARVLQHEVDHLNGVLILDNAIGGLYERSEEDDEYDEAEDAASPDAEPAQSVPDERGER